MPIEAFIDTNIFIYAAAGKLDQKAKWAKSHDVLSRDGCVISGQIMAEFFHNCQNKFNMDTDELDGWMAYLSGLVCLPVDAALVLEGAIISRRYKTSYWDAALLASATRLGAKQLITEDLNHEQFYGDVQVINPFKENLSAFQ